MSGERLQDHWSSGYEDLTKIIFELSSNIIKYAPYFFCCHTQARGSFLPADRQQFGLI